MDLFAELVDRSWFPPDSFCLLGLQTRRRSGALGEQERPGPIQAVNWFPSSWTDLQTFVQQIRSFSRELISSQRSSGCSLRRTTAERQLVSYLLHRSCERLDLLFQFLHFAVLFQKLVNQHPVHRFIADGLHFSVLITNY